MMKVLLVDQIAKTNFNNTFSLAKRLQAQGVDMVLAIDQQERYVSDLRDRGIEVHRLFKTDEKNIGKLEKARNYIASWRKIRQLIRSEQIDVLHIQWVILSPLDWVFLRSIKRRSRVRIVDTVHDILPFNEHFYDRHFYKKIYGLADSVVVQAQTNMDRFKTLFPRDAQKLTMIPLGNFNDYADAGDGSRLLRRWGIGEGDFVFLFIGQIKKVKGLDVLLEAFDRAHRGHPDMKLVIAGNPWKDDFAEYQAKIDDINAGGEASVFTDIRFIPDEELGDFYDLADVVVLPYRDIYQSGVVRLSYAYKKPVIATRLAAFKEVIQDGVTGWLCESCDADDLSQKLLAAYAYSAQISSMGVLGHSQVVQRFSWDGIACEYLNIYKMNAYAGVKS